MYGGDECDGLRRLYIFPQSHPVVWSLGGLLQVVLLTLASTFGTYINGASSYVEFGSILKNWPTIPQLIIQTLTLWFTSCVWQYVHSLVTKSDTWIFELSDIVWVTSACSAWLSSCSICWSSLVQSVRLTSSRAHIVSPILGYTFPTWGLVSQTL